MENELVPYIERFVSNSISTIWDCFYKDYKGNLPLTTFKRLQDYPVQPASMYKKQELDNKIHYIFVYPFVFDRLSFYFSIIVSNEFPNTTAFKVKAVTDPIEIPPSTNGTMNDFTSAFEIMIGSSTFDTAYKNKC